jgi:hypothetical protein
MEIIIRRLPAATTPDELIAFAAKALKPRWYFFEFSPLGRITNCEVYKVSDGDHNVIGYNGLIYIESEQAVDVIIKRLNGSQINRKTVDAGLYAMRSKENDRRRSNNNQAPGHAINHRSRDRRNTVVLLERLHH